MDGEVAALANGALKLAGLSTVAEDLAVKGNTDRLLCDNQAAVIVCKTGLSKENSRLIFTRYWLIRSLLANGDATIEHIPGTANKADFFTKLFLGG